MKKIKNSLRKKKLAGVCWKHKKYVKDRAANTVKEQEIEYNNKKVCKEYKIYKR